MKPHKLHIEALEIRRPFAADLDLLAVCDELIVPADAEVAPDSDGSSILPAIVAEENFKDCPEDGEDVEDSEIDPRAVEISFDDSDEATDGDVWYLGVRTYVQRNLEGTTADDSSESDAEDTEPADEETGAVDDLGGGEIVTFGAPEILMTAEPASEAEGAPDDTIETSDDPTEKPDASDNELDDSAPVILTMSPGDIASNTPTGPDSIEITPRPPRRWLFAGMGFARAIAGANLGNQTTHAGPVVTLAETTGNTATTDTPSPAIGRGLRFGIDARFRALARTQLGEGDNASPDASQESPSSAANGNSGGNPNVSRRRRFFR